MKTFSLSWFAFGSASRRAMFFAVAAVLGLSSAGGAEVFIGNMVFGATTNYTLPPGVSRIVVEVTGAGGDGRWEPDWSATGGNGGYAKASYAVSGGQVISINGSSASISGGFQIHAEDGTSAYEEDGEHYNGTDGGAYFDPGHGYIANSGSVGSAGNGSNGSSGDLYGGQGSVVIGLYTSQAPVITSALTGSYNAGTYFIYQITASGAPTSFNVVGLPDTCTFNPATAQIMVYLPTAGTTSFTVQATNAIGTGQATVTWNVSTAQAPQWQEIYRASGSIWTETDEDGGYHGSSDWHGFTAPVIGTIEVNVTGTANTQDSQQGQFRFNFSGEPGLTLSATMNVPAGATGAMIWGEPGWTAGDYEIVVRFRAMNLTPPTFTEQPAIGWYAPNQSVSFHVAATSYPGATIAYQWQRLPAGGGSWTNITGETTPSLTVSYLTAAMNGDQFRCIATNAVGATTSNAVPLSLATAPVFTTQPQNQTVVRPNESFSFTVAASGPPVPQYQWFRWYPGRGWEALIDDYNHSGTHSATLTVTHDSSYPESAASFLCTATNPAGIATSIPAIRTYVDPPSPPQFVTQPTNQTTYDGWTTFFLASARGSPAPTYQWESSATGLPPWTSVAEDPDHWGTTTSWLWVNPTSAMHGTRFRCVATNSLGTDTSQPAILYITSFFGVNVQPQSLTVAPGGTATFTATGVGTPPPNYYEWQRLVDGTWQAIGVYGNTLTVSGVTAGMNGYQYRCRASNGTSSADSNAAKLTVDSSKMNQPTVSSSNAIITLGQSFTPAMSGGAGSGAQQVKYNGYINWGDSNTWTAPNPGDHTFFVRKLGDAQYFDSNTAGPYTLTVLPGNSRYQRIVFFALPNRALQDGQFSINARATSGLPVSFSVSGPASLSGNNVVLSGPGVVSITASQSGNADFDPATAVTHSFTVVNAERPYSSPITSPGIAASPVPIASNEKLWYDIDGDGILDEIIPARTLGFHYEIVPAQSGIQINWYFSPFLYRGDYDPIWNPVPETSNSDEVYVDQLFWFDKPDSNYEYTVYGAIPGRDDRIQDWRLNGRARHTAEEISKGISELDQPLSGIVSTSIYLIRFGKRPENPNWTLLGIAGDPDPIRYYMSDPDRFVSLLPNWDWHALLHARDWDGQLVPDAASLEFAMAAAGIAVGVPVPRPIFLPIPVLYPSQGQSEDDQVTAGAALAALLAKLIPTDFSYVVYQKVNKLNPALVYVGRTWGSGDPGRRLFLRDRFHERNFDHQPATINAYVWAHQELPLPSLYGYYAMWGREQQVIDFQGGLLADGGRATNYIRSVARVNPLGKTLWLTSNLAFGGLAPFTGVFDSGIPKGPEYWISIIKQFPP